MFLFSLFPVLLFLSVVWSSPFTSSEVHGHQPHPLTHFFTVTKQEALSLPLTHHPSPITHHPSPITHHPSPITHHPSPITHHPSPITHHPSPITHHPSLVNLFKQLCCVLGVSRLYIFRLRVLHVYCPLASARLEEGNRGNSLKIIRTNVRRVRPGKHKKS